MAKIKYKLAIILAVLILAGVAAYVYFTQYLPLKLDEPAEIEIWYVNNEVAADFDSLVKRFNSEEGADREITAEVREFESDSALLEAVNTADENGDELPDAVMCDTNICACLHSMGVITELNSYNQVLDSKEYEKSISKLCTYNGKTICIPVAYETAVLAVNTKLYGNADDISSFEELCEVANSFYDENRESFFTITDYSAFFNSAMAQLGEQFKAENPFDYENENVRYIYDCLATAAFKRGYTAVADNPAALVAKGELACAIVSTSQVIAAAGEMDKDNIEFLPVPAMDGGDNACVPEMTGITILKSDANTEKATAIFLNWFTSDEVSSEYVGYSGFVPVNGVLQSYSDAPWEIYSELMMPLETVNFCSYNANPDYAVNCDEFNSIMDNIMKKSLS
ncbi:MAG: ABC transporter substrate-binding protein [Bacillota bacterium]|nr:ABC transporter substrate-binding protein [Bacillota bacterium]